VSGLGGRHKGVPLTVASCAVRMLACMGSRRCARVQAVVRVLISGEREPLKHRWAAPACPCRRPGDVHVRARLRETVNSQGAEHGRPRAAEPGRHGAHGGRHVGQEPRRHSAGASGECLPRRERAPCAAVTGRQQCGMRRALWALLYSLNAGMCPLAHLQRALPLGLDVEVNQVHTCEFTLVYTGLHIRVKTRIQHTPTCEV